MPIDIAEKDLTLETPHGMFNYRVGFLVFREDKVLLHKSGTGGWWFLPGGRVAFGESSEEALVRECEEEMGQSPASYEAAGVIENFFEMDGKDFHEISFLFRADFPGLENAPETDAHGKPITSGWFSPGDVAGLKLLPAVLKRNIFALQSGFHRFVQRD